MFKDEDYFLEKKEDSIDTESVLVEDDRVDPKKDFISFASWLKEKNVSGNVLDLGYVGGPNMMYLAQHDFNIYILDVSQFSIAVAAKNAKTAGVEKKVRLQIGDVFDLPYDSGFFDVINDDGCLHHVANSNWRAYLSNIKRVLKPGGVLRIKVHSMDSQYYQENRAGSSSHWILIPGKDFTYFFDESELRELFSHGFRELELKQLPHEDGKRAFFYGLFQRT